MLLTDVNDYPKVYNGDWLVLWQNGPVIWLWHGPGATVSQFTERYFLTAPIPVVGQSQPLTPEHFQQLLDVVRQEVCGPYLYPSLKGLQHATDG